MLQDVTALITFIAFQLQFREPSTKKGKPDVDNASESGERNSEVSASPRTGSRRMETSRIVSNIGPLETEGMGLDQAILYSIDCCGKSTSILC